jgi:hypothetical protein
MAIGSDQWTDVPFVAVPAQHQHMPLIASYLTRIGLPRSAARRQGSRPSRGVRR